MSKAKSTKTNKQSKPAKTEKPTPKQASVKAEQRNGITQPGEGTLCRKVWDVLDKLRADGKEATLDAVRELAGKEMADATIRTQRQRHKTFHAKTT